MHTLKSCLALFVALILTFAGQHVVAQDAPTNIAPNYRVKVKPGMGSAFEMALKEHIAWRKAQGDPWTWDVYQVAVGDNIGDYSIRSANHAFADIDAYERWSMESGASQNFQATVAPYVETITHSVSVLNTELLRWPEDTEGYTLFSVDRYQLKPGQQPVFEAVIKKFHDAAVQHDYPSYFAVLWGGLGAERPTVSIVSPYKSWADMEGPDEELGDFLTRALGEEAAGEMYQQYSGSWTTMKNYVTRHRPDLSSSSAMASN